MIFQVSCDVDVDVVAADGGGADVRAVGEIRWGDGDGVAIGVAGEQAGEGVGQRIAGIDVVRAALRRDEDGRVGGAAAEVVFAVGADAEVCGVAIEARLGAELEGVAAGGSGEVLLALEEIAVGLHDRSGGGVEAFKEAVVELDRGVSVVGRGKAGRGARDAERTTRQVRCGETVRV